MAIGRWLAKAVMVFAAVIAVGWATSRSIPEARPIPEEVLAELACLGPRPAGTGQGITEITFVDHQESVDLRIRVTLRSDGRTMQRISGDLTGHLWCGRISPAEFAHLATLLESVGFFELGERQGCRTYPTIDVACSGGTSVTAVREGTSKTVRVFPGAPAELIDVERDIEKMASGIQWVSSPLPSAESL